MSEGEDAHFILSFSETLNHSASSLSHLYEGAHIYGEIAKARTENVTKYVGTPAVARDMLEIVKAHGRDKLHYWGFSWVSFTPVSFVFTYPHSSSGMGPCLAQRKWRDLANNIYLLTWYLVHSFAAMFPVSQFHLTHSLALDHKGTRITLAVSF